MSRLVFLLCCCCLAAWSPWLPPAARALPLCTDGRAPVALNRTLGFCSVYSLGSSSCCNAAADTALRKRFEAMEVKDSACAAVIKSILCAKCNPFSAELFNTSSTILMVPLLCNNTSSASSDQSKDSTLDYCKQVWKTCKNVAVANSPFQPHLQGKARIPSSSSKLTDIWRTEKDFCTSFGGSSDDQTLCFSGNAISFNAGEPSPPPRGVCLERISNGSYLNMAPHPDGSNRVFLSNQAGKIWLATVPEQGSGGTLEFDEANPFLDLTDEVHYDSVFGLMGIAFHPKFATNGRFFVSYDCDRTQSPNCAGRCSCNSDAGCDPSKLGTGDAQPCQYQVVVSEYSAKFPSSNISMATSADPSEVRRIFTMGMPYTTHYGGQILFGPTDGYLYLVTGDGGNKGDPNHFSQNKKSLLGKILRLDIDGTKNQRQISLWGNYSIPMDNPFVDDNDLQPEIWAMGLGNSWRCSFDSERPSYFYCGDCGQDMYEEVNLITKGKNYGWPVYEGPYIYHPQKSLGGNTPEGNTSVDPTNFIFPIMGYNHSSVNKNSGSASIAGGYVYRGSTDPCLYGRYLYTDLYSSSMWTGTEIPEGSGNYTTAVIPMSCSKTSPIACESTVGSPDPLLGYIFTFGEDSNKDIFLVASKGIYRVVRPSLCGFTCPAEKPAANNETTPPGPSSSAPATRPWKPVAIALSIFVCAMFS